MKTPSDPALLRERILSGTATPAEWDEFNLAAFSDPSVLEALDAALGACPSEATAEPPVEVEREILSAFGMEVYARIGMEAEIRDAILSSCRVRRGMVLGFKSMGRVVIDSGRCRDQRVLARRSSAIVKGRYGGLIDFGISRVVEVWDTTSLRVHAYFAQKRHWWAEHCAALARRAHILRDFFTAGISHWFAPRREPERQLPWDEHWRHRHDPASPLAGGPQTRPYLRQRQAVHRHLALGGMGMCALVVAALSQPDIVGARLLRLLHPDVSPSVVREIPPEHDAIDFVEELWDSLPVPDNPAPEEASWWKQEKQASRQAFLLGAPAGFAHSPLTKRMGHLMAHVPFPEERGKLAPQRESSDSTGIARLLAAGDVKTDTNAGCQPGDVLSVKVSKPGYLYVVSISTCGPSQEQWSQALAMQQPGQQAFYERVLAVPDSPRHAISVYKDSLTGMEFVSVPGKQARRRPYWLGAGHSKIEDRVCGYDVSAPSCHIILARYEAASGPWIDLSCIMTQSVDVRLPIHAPIKLSKSSIWDSQNGWNHPLAHANKPETIVLDWGGDMSVRF